MPACNVNGVFGDQRNLSTGACSTGFGACPLTSFHACCQLDANTRSVGPGVVEFDTNTPQ